MEKSNKLDYKDLKFHQRKFPSIYTKSKTATVRYDDEKEIEKGDLLRILDQNGNPLETAVVTHTTKCYLLDAVETINRLGEKHESDNRLDLLGEMRRFYEDDITLTTTVKIITFDVDKEWPCECGGRQETYDYHSESGCSKTKP